MPEYLAEILMTKRFTLRVDAANQEEAVEKAGVAELPGESDSTEEELVSVRPVMETTDDGA